MHTMLIDTTTVLAPIGWGFAGLFGSAVIALIAGVIAARPDHSSPPAGAAGQPPVQLEPERLSEAA